jgi:two-component system alkaline phosphatase synthesis response regulator PhoP
MSLTVDSLTPETISPEIAAAPSGHRVLVIDDSVLIREAAKVALGAIGGWSVLTAASGQEGIAVAESEQPDAIVLDVVMPGMDGIAVAVCLRAAPATGSLPIVLLTAKDRPEDRERFRRLPVAGVIAKPFDVASLADELAALLGWPT